MDDHQKYLNFNKKNWDSRVSIHQQSKVIYNIEEFKKGKLSFVANEHKELTEVRGKSLLHLQCHFGLDTMSWTRLGANATGVDFSSEAIDLANKIRDDLELDTKFIQSDIYSLEEKLDQQFDIVFTSCGVLPWLPDLKAWARVVTRYLKDNGTFYLKDSHPITHCLDYDAKTPQELRLIYPYFPQQTPSKYESEFTYAHDGTDKLLKHKISFEWTHSLSEIINSLIEAGITIDKVLESHYGFFQAFEFMYQNERGQWVMPEELQETIPLTVTIIGRKT